MPTTIEPLPFGLSWTQDEPLTRTSHALATPGGVWLVDPVDDPAAMERVAALGRPAGVLQLLGRHGRDGAAIAARLGVPHLQLPTAIPDSPFTVVGVLSAPGWREVALWWPEPKALVVAELIGTNAVYAVGGAPAGVHPLLRLLTPGALRAYQPEHLLVGHGRGIHGPEAVTALASAYDRARSDLPRLLARLPALARSMR